MKTSLPYSPQELADAEASLRAGLTQDRSSALPCEGCNATTDTGNEVWSFALIQTQPREAELYPALVSATGWTFGDEKAMCGTCPQCFAIEGVRSIQFAKNAQED